MKPKLTAIIREQISLRRKKNLDISDLISGYDICGEDLSNTTIEFCNRMDDNISRCNFAGARLGKEGVITNWSRANAKGCNFKDTKFLGTFWCRYTDFRNSTFIHAQVINVDYKFADFRGCDFCYAAFSVGTNNALGSKFDDKFFKDMAEQWNIGILTKDEYDKYLKWKQNNDNI